MLKISLIVPTYNAGNLWKNVLSSISQQSLKIENKLIIDSSSSDNTIVLAKQAGFEIINISKSEFNHGGTRNTAISYAHNKYHTDIIIFLTQDAILASDKSLEAIVNPFINDEDIMAVCGRQLPHQWADPIAQHSRYYNYQDKSFLNTEASIAEKGLKAAYMSNSFAAYRYSAFEECGGFPEELIFGEDMYLAAKMLLKGYKTYYSADATVYHSHNYSIFQEFKRYFDIGVFHFNQQFLLENFGKPTGEGLKFAFSEIKYAFKYGGLFWSISSILRSGFKFIAYKLGKNHGMLSIQIKRIISMDKYYWK